MPLLLLSLPLPCLLLGAREAERGWQRDRKGGGVPGREEEEEPRHGGAL